ncbi:hypothetical protein [Streptomyces sp. V4I2]|uniref:hypothetical protein n=1 Tax=Streptomyces sp. V4I2 TaxID=3042280 RepID=UPI002787920D|nr:hypothetical protein [Streptomyces sp. V4I2]MDQ1051771.1 hypothetical protein [Streptomyces sp. V4I2]
MLTTPEVRDHIRDLTDAKSLVAIQEAATARLLELDAEKRPVITPGRSAEIDSTISRACLRFLTGTVQQPNRTGRRFDILLDEASTKRLRSDQTNRWHTIPDDVERFRLTGIPAGCIKLTDEADS